MPFATTWKVPPAGPPPKITLVLRANESVEKTRAIVKNAQILIITIENLFLMSNPP
jgi:hypothetical protein